MSLPKYNAIPFSRWVQENESDLLKEFDIVATPGQDDTCEKCGGLGFVQCDMGHEHECEDCEGDGKVTLTPEQLFQQYSRDEYDFRKAVDFKKWTEYNKFMEKEHVV